MVPASESRRSCGKRGAHRCSDSVSLQGWQRDDTPGTHGETTRNGQSRSARDGFRRRKVDKLFHKALDRLNAAKDTRKATPKNPPKTSLAVCILQV